MSPTLTAPLIPLQGGHQLHRTVSDTKTVNANTVRSFSTHGHQSGAKGGSSTFSRSDIRLIQLFDSALCLMVRRWRLIGYFPILQTPLHLKSAVAGGSSPESPRRASPRSSRRWR
jgi:hypothetical protein